MAHGSGFHPLPIAGLTFRHYQGEQDLPAMLDVFHSSRNTVQDFDHDDTVLESLADITHKYRHLINCDPYQDVLIAEVDGQMIAHGRVAWWQVEASGARIYFMAWYMRPNWRGQGLEKFFLEHSKQRLREIIRQQDSQSPANGIPFSGARLFEANATNLESEACRLLEEDGFQPVQWASSMTCPDLRNIADAPLPQGLEVRPVKPEHYRPIWDALLEAFHDDPGYVQPSESEYAGWQQSSQFQPHLWQVAWDQDQVAGMVLNYITRAPAGADPTSLAASEPSIAWTEDICVRPAWRRRGLARALLASSMRMFREMGFIQTSLGVDIHNPHGARQLYESMGYRIVQLFIVYRKPVD